MLPILTLCCSALIVLSFSPLFVELTLLIVLIDECESLFSDRLLMLGEHLVDDDILLDVLVINLGTGILFC